jgi:hypothetical protein
MSWTIIIIFLLAGVLLMLLEVLVVPGATIFGVLGFLLIGVSIWQAYAAHGTPEGHYFLAGTFVLTIVLSFICPEIQNMAKGHAWIEVSDQK